VVSEACVVRRFFITGLPRSRTAWFANYFTYGEHLCFHDLTARCREVRDMEDWLKSFDGWCGNADSGLMAIAPDVARRYPGARWLLVDRSPAEVARSLGANPWEVLHMERLKDAVRNTDNVFEVGFDEIDERIEEIEDWFGFSHPADRRELLLSMNVQLTSDALRESAMRPHALVRRALGV
jgi:hypothetical protein